ncbi:MAG TPA: hypothetical protein VMR41_03140 [Patescibacteria group bacterium]|nr:hypothetical protein [Patescibacteria group bacterium]
MGNHSGFFKGEKKKKRKEIVGGSAYSTAPTFVLPKMVEKKKKSA